MESLICPACTTLQTSDAGSCGWCDARRPSRGWLTANTLADPWIGTVLPGKITVAQRISSVDRLYRAQSALGRNLFARFRRINRLATPADWTTRATKLVDACSRRIARFVDALEHDEYGVLLSEYVEGERLHDLLQRCGALQPTDALDIARQVAIGIESLHRLGLVHGRLNPRGVVVATDSRGALRATVISYGFSGCLEPPSPQAGYLPEAAGRTRATDDIYAVGALLFEMLTGVQPEHGAVDAKLRDIALSPLMNPSAVHRVLAGARELDRLVQTLTAAEGSRIDTIEDAIDLLDEACICPDSDEFTVAPDSLHGLLGQSEGGLSAAMSTSATSLAQESFAIDHDGAQLAIRVSGSAVMARPADSDRAHVLVDIADHDMDGRISRVVWNGDRLLIGTTRGALAAFDIDRRMLALLEPKTDGSAIVEIAAAGDVIVAATRRGSVVCVAGIRAHLIPPLSFVTGISVSATRRRFAIGRASGDVEVFELRDDGPHRISDFVVAQMTRIKLSDCGRQIWISDRDTTMVRDLSTGSNVGMVGAFDEVVHTSDMIRALADEHDFGD